MRSIRPVFQALYPMRGLALCLLFSHLLFAQSPSMQTAAVPHLVQFSGAIKDARRAPDGKVVGITFALYRDEEGSAPLWLETQNVTLDATGHYTVMLGANTSGGLPIELFASKEAHWLGIEPQGLVAPARVLLLSVPYALKAGDAETIGGLPPSAFVLAAPGSSQSTGAAPVLGGSADAPAPPPAVNMNFIPEFTTDSGALGNSTLYQSGSGTSAKVGINNTSPSTTLDVKGTATIRGNLTLPATGTATAASGKNSQPLNAAASTFDSSTSTAVKEMFRWQAEPVGNNTSNPSGTLNLLFASGSAIPAETGLNISNLGILTFAPNQTFPGTIAGVTPGTGLLGGGTSGNVTLSLDTSNVPQLKVSNTFDANQIFNGNITVNGGTTLNGNTTVNGSLTTGNILATTVTAAGPIGGQTVNAANAYNLSGLPFAFGSYSNHNAYLGYAANGGFSGSGNTATGADALFNASGSNNTANGSAALFHNGTGGSNTAVGALALYANSGGGANTAVGYNALTKNQGGGNNEASGVAALQSNTSGSFNTAEGSFALADNTTNGGNTAVGASALGTNQGANNTAIGANAGQTTNIVVTTGSNNTFVGYGSTPGTQTALNNAGAIGALAEVTESNALVLGSINGVNGATADTLVGIGTTAPTFKLHVGLGANGLRVEGPATTGSIAASFGGNGDFRIDAPGCPACRFVVKDNGSGPAVQVGIGISTPDSTLTVFGTADKLGGGSWAAYSDGRLKTVHGDFGAGLNEILKLRPVRYSYKKENALGIHDSDEHIGFVAQEVQKVIPEAVTENNKGYLLVNNDPILWAMLNAIKEQQREIASLRAQLRRHARNNAALESRLARLERGPQTVIALK